MTATNQSDILKKLKADYIREMLYCYLSKNLLSPHITFKSLMIKICTIVILLVVLHVCAKPGLPF